MKDISFGVIGGLIGAAVWAGVAAFLEYEVGWIAWGVGGLVGYGVALGNKDRGRSPTAAGVIAVAITVLSIAAGKYAAIQVMMPGDEELVDMLTEGFDDEEFVMSFVADDVVEEFVEAERAVEWPEGVDRDNASGELDYPPDVWAEAALRWDAMGETERTAFREEKEAESRANIEGNLTEIRALIARGGFFGSFTPVDLIFFGLAAVTAWGLGSGRKSKEQIATAYKGVLMLSMYRVTGAEGAVGEAELESILSVVKDVFGAEVDADAIRTEAQKDHGEPAELIKALRDLSPHLDVAQRETIVRSVVRVALADGSVAPDEQRFIEQVATAIDVSDAHLRGILNEVALAAQGEPTT